NSLRPTTAGVISPRGRLPGVLAVSFVIAAISPCSHAQDPTIDRLLKKLPPPEKLVKPSVNQTLQQPNPVMNDPLLKTAVAQARGGNMAGALATVRALVAKHPRNATAHELHGVCAFFARQLPEARAAFGRALEVEPKRSSSHFNLVIVSFAQQRPALALPHARRLTELEPKWADAWVLLSGCEEVVGHKEQSAAAARRATTIAPSMLAAWVQLARAENRLRRPQEAVRALNSAAEIAPDNATVQATAGFGLINLNRNAEAVRPLSRAARLAPKDYLVQAQLGWALYAAGQTEAAIQHLRRGTALNSSYGPAWRHLGLAYQKQGREREAQEAFQRAARLMPGGRGSGAQAANARR
ncbi:MAG TPA: tetratricopeptide repeat protein, partial [Chthoniobacterales bacterium]